MNPLIPAAAATVLAAGEVLLFRVARVPSEPTMPVPQPIEVAALAETLADLPDADGRLRVLLAPRLLRALGLGAGRGVRSCAECGDPLPAGRTPYCSSLCRNAADPHDELDYLTDEESV